MKINTNEFRDTMKTIAGRGGEILLWLLRHVLALLKRLVRWFVKEVKKFPDGTYTHYKLFPIVFVYDEVLLRLFNGTSLFSHLFFCVAVCVVGRITLRGGDFSV